MKKLTRYLDSNTFTQISRFKSDSGCNLQNINVINNVIDGLKLNNLWQYTAALYFPHATNLSTSTVNTIYDLCGKTDFYITGTSRPTYVLDGIIPYISFTSSNYMAQKSIVSGTVTRPNMKISSVNGSAFIDFNTSNFFSSYLGKFIVITDTAGKRISGYIKSAGTGETYSDNLLTDGGFSIWTDATNLTNYNKSLSGTSTLNRESSIIYAGTYAARFDVDSSNSVMSIGQAISGATNKLLTLSVYARSSAGTPTFRFGSTSNGATDIYTSKTISTTFTNYSTYYNYDSTGVGIKRESAASKSLYFDDFAAKQVLTPSATGCNIVNTLNGSTYNWTVIESSFNMNDTSYTYAIYNPDLNFTSAMSGVMFINGASQSKELLTGKHSTGLNERAYLVEVSSGKGAFRTSSDGTSNTAKVYVSSVTACDSTWHSFGFSFGSNSLSLYNDGVLDSNPTKNADNTVNSIYDSPGQLLLVYTATIKLGPFVLFNKRLTTAEQLIVHNLLKSLVGKT